MWSVRITSVHARATRAEDMKSTSLHRKHGNCIILGKEGGTEYLLQYNCSRSHIERRRSHAHDIVAVWKVLLSEKIVQRDPMRSRQGVREGDTC